MLLNETNDAYELKPKNNLVLIDTYALPEANSQNYSSATIMLNSFRQPTHI